jgi:hypothetical protein
MNNNRAEEMKKHCRRICTGYTEGQQVFIRYALKEIWKSIPAEEYRRFLGELNSICRSNSVVE